MKKFLTLLAAFTVGSLASLGVVFAQGAMVEFPDVDYNAYYGDAVTDMSMRSIITGYENGNFGPNDSTSRAQLATILYRYDNQLINAYHDGGVGPLQTLICAGINKADLPTSDPAWGNVQDVYDEVCATP